MAHLKSDKFNFFGFIVKLCFASALIVLSLGIYSRFWYQNSDGAAFMELVNRSFNEMQLNSNSFSAAIDLVRIVWNSSFDCTDNSYLLANTNIANVHPYNISYFLSFISSYLPFSSLVFISLIFGINFLIPLYFAVNLFFKDNFSRLSFPIKLYRSVLVLIVLSLIIWPPFLTGIQGQFYFDRLSISLFFLISFLLPKLHNASLGNLVVFFLALYTVPFVSERTTIVAVLCSFFTILFMFYKGIKNKCIIILVSVHFVLFTTYYLYWKNYVSDPSLNTIPNVSNVMDRLSYLINNPVASGLFVFLLVLTPILLMSVYSKINLILTIIVAFPNIIFNIGGAELNGYITHYHSLYTGFAIAGVLNSFEKFNMKPRKFISQLFLIITISISIMSSYFYYGSSGSLIRNLSSSSGIENLSNATRINQDPFILGDEYKRILNTSSTYTISDSLFPSFISKNIYNIHMFPVNLGKSDYVITELSLDNNLPAIQPWIYPDKKVRENVQICIQSRLDNEYKFLFQKDNYFIYEKSFNQK